MIQIYVFKKINLYWVLCNAYFTKKISKQMFQYSFVIFNLVEILSFNLFEFLI